jgi:hypothetical protein
MRWIVPGGMFGSQWQGCDERQRSKSTSVAARSWRPHPGGRSGLSLLYFGRHVLIPVALALMISLLLAPAVRAPRRTEVGHAPSVLIAALMLAVSCLTVTVAIGAQVLCIAESIPQYEATIHRKLKTLDESTLGRVRALISEASDLVTIQDPTTSSSPERKRSEELHQQVQELLPRAQVVSLFCPGVTASPDEEFADASAVTRPR